MNLSIKATLSGVALVVIAMGTVGCADREEQDNLNRMNKALSNQKSGTGSAAPGAPKAGPPPGTPGAEAYGGSGQPR